MIRTHLRLTAVEFLAVQASDPIHFSAQGAVVPWTESRYPRSMEHLQPQVRSKAIAIANALLEEGYEEGMAIRIAIAKAKEWTERQGLRRP